MAVVNELFVKKYFHGENPIGRHFLLGRDKTGFRNRRRVAKNGPLNSLKRDIPAMAYVPYTQNPAQSLGR